MHELRAVAAQLAAGLFKGRRRAKDVLVGQHR
jgi:hypothetical protein